MQIRELTKNTELRDVIRIDFGSRIRNACVIGAPSYRRRPDDGATSVPKTGDDEDIEMTNSSPPDASQRDKFPPQMLALVLDGGKLVFLYVAKTADGSPKFVHSVQDIPASHLVAPGYHMTVDPGSRYLTLACSENLFLVYQLESMETLRSQHAQGLPLNPTKAVRARAVNGLIHKIEFLHPNPDDSDWHVILMLIVIRNEVSRLATYDWEVEDDMDVVFEKEKKGHRLEHEWSMPLLVVPLTVRYSFLLITETGAAICADGIHAPMHIERHELGDPEKTELHFGKGRPVWTAWSRPFRLVEFHREHDVIYLAREDGFINFLEIGYESLETSVSIGSVECNIDLAFACLYHYSADVLITGGDSGAGGIWNVRWPKALASRSFLLTFGSLHRSKQERACNGFALFRTGLRQ